MKIADRKTCAFWMRSKRSRVMAWTMAMVLLFPWTGRAEDGVTEDTVTEDTVTEDGVTVSAEALAASANYGLEAEEWWEPKPIRSDRGVLRATLDVRMAKHTVRDHTGATRQLNLRSYNGQLVGPTLVFRAGDTLYVKLVNRLPKNPGAPADPEAAAAAHHAAMSRCPNKPHDFNTTNLHTHGLHISPEEPADAVLIGIEPEGGSYDYIFPILPAGNPRGQPHGEHYPGTFWYHAHLHGSTAMQLASGMAGALILEGDVDEVPEIQSANDRLFILQQIAYDKDGEIKDFGDLQNNWNNVVEKRTRINGRLYPKIVLRPGQIERWRMIDSGVFADLPLRIVPKIPGSPAMPMVQIAADGITFARPRGVEQIDLAPGNRADILVMAPPRPGTYYLRKDGSQYDLTGFGDATPAGPELLAEIEIRGTPCRRDEPGCGRGIPTSLPAPTRMLPPICDDEITARKTVTFSVDPTTRPPKFMIDGDCYKENQILPNFDLTCGDVEEWTLVNTSGGPHPFHIHVNAFQVMDEGGVWRDTVMLPPCDRKPCKGTRIRTRFERFTGKFVTHCHILTHEDLGMMQEVRIQEPQDD